jgi:anti-anti-sigma regulatory factor
VIFSIFGRKSTPSKKAESKPPTGKAPAAKPTSPSGKPASPASQTETVEAAGEDSLDFSTYVPPPPSEQRAEALSAVPPAPPAAPAQQEATPSSSVEMPAAAPAAPPLPTERGAHLSVPGAATEIDAPAERLAPIIEETAILFANGQVEQALARLSNSVREGGLGNSALQAWLMLFDLLQHLDMRVEFEALALEFVVEFERSPPAWLETGERKDPALATGGIAYFALGGTLTDASAPELEKLRNAAAGRQALRVECGKLEGVDGPGCRLFRETLTSLRDAGKEVLLTGEARLIQFLEEACRPGRIETDGAVWALLLDVYRILDFKDKFEEAAVNYAVTFEVSPPSWESRPGAEARGSAVLPVEAADQALVLSGELSGASEALAKQLQDWAAADKMLVIDMSRATRVDPATAGLMLKVLSALHESGVTIQIRGANELIRALFGVTGLSRIARIIPRK